MDLSVSIVSWNTRALLDQCLESVYSAARGLEIEVIVVDNDSSDGSTEMVRRDYPDAQVIANAANVGFAKANNQALGVSSGRNFMLLNPDTICRGDAVARLVKFLDCTPSAGAVGPLVLNDDGTLQYSWARFPTLASEAMGRLDRRAEDSDFVPQDTDQTRSLGPFAAQWIGGCALAIRRTCAEAIGPMDESLFMYCEETDWCLRLRRAGWEIWVDPSAEIVHLGGQSSMQDCARTTRELRRSKVAYMRKHHGWFSSLILNAALRTRPAIKALTQPGIRRR